MPSTVQGPRGRMSGDGAGAATPLAAHRFRNSQVFTSDGAFGNVTSVLIGDDGRNYAVVDFGRELGSHQIPLSSFTYESNRFVVHESDVRSLPSYVEGQRGVRSLDPAATITIPGYRMAADVEDSTIRVESAAAHVTVQRPALQINWEQAPPQVTVHQPTPQVNVRQAQPVIIVRQPPPKITVELEQPEIIVRMPDPEVDVAIAEPHVEVSVAKPFVQVVQPEQPQVNITAGEPTVSLMPRHRAEVAVERGQAEVRYERTGEPQLFFKQGDGAPKIRFENVVKDEAARGAFRTDGPLTAGQLLDRKVFSMEGEEVGTVQRVLTGPSGDLYLVVTRRGFLGIPGHKILIRLANFATRGDRLFIRSMTADDVRKMDAWDEKMDLYSPASMERLTPIGPWS